jgi:hypothetical protein
LFIKENMPTDAAYLSQTPHDTDGKVVAKATSSGAGGGEMPVNRMPALASPHGTAIA